MNHYPLIIVTAFNRKEETARTLASLERTIRPGEAHIVLIDNGSSDGADQVLKDSYAFMQDRDVDVDIHLFGKNLGCPAALNFAMDAYRYSGQPVVKIDNDIEIVTSDWVGMVGEVIAELRVNEHGLFRGPPAMIGAMMGDKVNQERLLSRHPYMVRWGDLWLSSPIIGHAVWHDGVFLNEVGYFDVLDDGHLYGFEDLIMSHKATAMGAVCGIWSGWVALDLQRHSAMPRQEQTGHVARLRPLYDKRVAALREGGSIWTGPDGRPAEKP